MSEPRRILEGSSTTPFERDLLESWSSEQPSAAARARALAIAGAAAGTLAAATVATAAASATGVGTAAGAAAPGAAGVGITVAMKWGILFVAVAASAVASIVVLGSPRTEEGTATVALPAAALPSAPAAARPAIEPKTVSPADLPAAAPTAAVAAAAAPSAPTAAPHGRGALATPGDSSLAEEIAAFDRARAALDAGDADRALGLLDAYEKRFPGGTFVQEAEVLRVQALARKGDSAGARRAGQRFLAAHPTSPHAARIRAILDASNP